MSARMDDLGTVTRISPSQTARHHGNPSRSWISPESFCCSTNPFLAICRPATSWSGLGGRLLLDANHSYLSSASMMQMSLRVPMMSSTWFNKLVLAS